jgi:hypothetical protein
MPTPLLHGSIVRRTAVAAVSVAFLTAAGCVQVPNENPRKAPVITKRTGESTARAGRPADAPPAEPDVIEIPNVPSQPNALDALAPCDAKLDNLGGLLLLYYASKKTLPPRLDDLAPLAQPGLLADFTCPFANRPYVYTRQNLNPSISGLKLIAYAPAPGKDGLRRALMMGFDSSKGVMTPATKTEQFTEAQLQEQLRRVVPVDPPVGAAATPNP